jgi:hypothetical protein
LLAQEKVTKENGTLPPRPCGVPSSEPFSRGLRNSPWQLAQTASCCGAQTVLAYPSRLNGPDEAMQKGRKALTARSYAQARDGLFLFGLPGLCPDRGSWFCFGFLNLVFGILFLIFPPLAPPSSGG